MEPDGFWKKKKKRIQVQTGASEATRHRKRHQGKKSAELTANNQTFRSDSRSIFLFLFFLSSTRKSHTPANNEQIIRGIYSQKKKRTKKDFLFFFSRAVISFLLTIVLSGAQFKSKKRNWSICHRCRQ